MNEPDQMKQNILDELQPSKITKLEEETKKSILSLCLSFAFYWHTKEEFQSFLYSKMTNKADDSLFIGYIVNKLAMQKDSVNDVLQQFRDSMESFDKNQLVGGPILSPWEWWIMTQAEKYECFDNAPLWKSTPSELPSDFANLRDPSLYDNEIIVFEKASSDPSSSTLKQQTCFDDDDATNSPTLDTTNNIKITTIHVGNQSEIIKKVKSLDDISTSSSVNQSDEFDLDEDKNWALNYKRNQKFPAPLESEIAKLRLLDNELRTTILWDLFVMSIACTGGLDSRIQISLLVAAKFLNIETKTVLEFESKFAVLARNMLSASALSSSDNEDQLPEDASRWWKIGLGAAVSCFLSTMQIE